MRVPILAPGSDPSRLFGLLALIVLGGACLLVLRPFISALLWAAILVYSTWPAYRALRERLGLGASGAAAVMVAAAFLLLVLPLVLATPTSREEIEALRRGVEGLLSRGLPSFGDWLGRLPWIGASIAKYVQGLDSGLGGLLASLRPYAGSLAQEGLALLLAVLSGLAQVVIAILLAFFFYRDGPAIAGRLEAVLHRLAGERAHDLLALTGAVTRGVVYGLLGTALVQGVLTTFGLWVSGVPQPLLLGVIAGVISILPVGAPLVWIPASIWLLAEGRTGWGIFLFLYGALGISSVDNFVRPWLISRGADLPLLLTLLGAFGGVFAFGFLGLFLGPVLLALGYTLLRQWADTDRLAAETGD